MLKPEYTNQFNRDVKKMQKRGKNTLKLRSLLELIINESSIPPKYRDHKLTGNCKDHRECHIEPDWLLVYKIIGKTLILVRTGTHSDLF